MNEDNRLLISVGDLIRKKEKSLKISFMVKQFFVANSLIKLVEDQLLFIGIDKNGKLYMGFEMADDPEHGFQKRKVDLHFTAIKHISFKSNVENEPPVLVCSLSDGAYKKLCEVQPGLEQLVDKNLEYNKQYKRNVIIVLEPFPLPYEGDQAYAFVKAEYRVPDYDECFFDFQCARLFLEKDLVDFWLELERALRNGKARRYDEGPITTNLTQDEWKDVLKNHQLGKGGVSEFGYDLYQIEYVDKKYRLKLNSPEYMRTWFPTYVDFRDQQLVQEEEPQNNRPMNGNPARAVAPAVAPVVAVHHDRPPPMLLHKRKGPVIRLPQQRRLRPA